MPPRRLPTRLLPLLLALALPVGAQEPRDSPAAPERAPGGAVRALTTIGGAAEEALRDAQLRGRAPVDGFLVRSPSSLAADRGNGLWIVAPEATLAWNSAIPFSINDGALWAAKGLSGLVMTGVQAQAGPVRLVLAPELSYSENGAFDDILPYDWGPEQRALYRAPWQSGTHSIDLPVRPGGGERRRIHPGQSSLTVRAGPVSLGAATENQWWGPGVRNAVLLGGQAAGIPHLFLRTARPVSTPLGRVEARWIAGGLRESEWFNTDASDDWRSLSAAAVVLTPAKGVSLGVARSVYSGADGAAGVLKNGGDVLLRWRGAGDTLAARPFEQMTSLFGRIVMPADGAEAYVEWVRYRLPGSVRELLEAPEHTQGYTVGMQWLRPAPGGGVRLQAEHTYLEKSPSYRALPMGSYYASPAVPQGYTHEGQVIGAPVGPGASGQWLGVDWLGRGARAGVFGGRIRWANDALYDKPAPNAGFRGHDVTLLAGLRGAADVGGARVSLEWTAGKRWNYLFQGYAFDWDQRENAVNVVNHTLRLQVSAAPGRSAGGAR